MAAAMNGMSHCMAAYAPAGGTFLIFTDYCAAGDAARGADAQRAGDLRDDA